jgi:hypothetical protein
VRNFDHDVDLFGHRVADRQLEVVRTLLSHS